MPTLTYDYKLNSQTSLGLQVSMEGASYALTDVDDRILYDSDGNVKNEGAGTEVAFSEIKIGPHFKTQPGSGAFTVTLDAGISAARRFEFVAQGDSETFRIAPGNEAAGEKLDFSPKSVGFVKLGVDFKF